MLLSATLLLATTALFAAPPALPPTPASIDSLILARPFTLDEGFEFSWRAERPLVTDGYLLVLSVDPNLVYPRQTAEPVLFVGEQTAMRLNIAYPSGRVVALVPGDLPEASTWIWFGTPGLPEQVTAERVAEERELAVAAGIGPVAALDLSAALQMGGERLRASTLDELLVEAAKLER